LVFSANFLQVLLISGQGKVGRNPEFIKIFSGLICGIDFRDVHCFSSLFDHKGIVICGGIYRIAGINRCRPFPAIFGGIKQVKAPHAVMAL
jgi:hypothetical protein